MLFLLETCSTGRLYVAPAMRTLGEACTLTTSPGTLSASSR
jgi:hypothetical protein